MEQNEFKPFEMWRDHFGLAELVQSGKLRDEKLGDEEEIVSVPEKQPKCIQALSLVGRLAAYVVH